MGPAAAPAGRAPALGLNAEMGLWTKAGHVKIRTGRGVDVRRLDALIARLVLGD